MDKYRAIPENYMTVGELAKKMGVTVRTLHYYDKAGLLPPSSESKSGYRLYSDKDMVALNQILAMKHLGFSLDDIKNHFVTLETPDDVADALTEQATAIREKMKQLAESLETIEMLKAEVLQMQSVDFRKYAAIIENLQMKNVHYWAIKHFDDELFDHLRQYDKESAAKIVKTLNCLNIEGTRLHKKGILPESDKGQLFAKSYWELLITFVKGDMNLISKLAKIHNSFDEKFNDKPASTFIYGALDIYLTKLNTDPFGLYVQNKTEKM
ncbi:MAG: MerR family transcriptional regulator [Defluviitaleaceae bacterium]|nr:MerR family transcriptional regulator [Defluviitaleaceae bacterium]